VPLVREKTIGEDWLKGGLELDSRVFGQGGTPEVKMKLGLRRHLLDGVFGFDAAIDASIARLLGTNHPGFDQRLHVSAEKSLGGGWQTGIEAEFGARGGFTLNQASEYSSLVQWRTRYKVSAADGAEHQVELKITHETQRGGFLGYSSQDLRTDLDYQYRRDGNVLSLDVSFIETRQDNSRGNDFRAVLRLARQF
jgi:hypothetical protein